MSDTLSDRGDEGTQRGCIIISGENRVSQLIQPKAPRLELGDDLNALILDLSDTNLDLSTAEIAANAPRYRRKSSTFIDGIHDVPEDQGDLAPAQLYSTMSGRLFHSGRIAIVMVGLPARGKT